MKATEKCFNPSFSSGTWLMFIIITISFWSNTATYDCNTGSNHSCDIFSCATDNIPLRQSFDTEKDTSYKK